MNWNGTVNVGCIDFDISCTIFPGCRGSRNEWGQQMEPDEGPMVEDLEVTLGGWDITDIIKDHILTNLEESILEQAGKEW